MADRELDLHKALREALEAGGDADRPTYRATTLLEQIGVQLERPDVGGGDGDDAERIPIDPTRRTLDEKSALRDTVPLDGPRGDAGGASRDADDGVHPDADAAGLPDEPLDRASADSAVVEVPKEAEGRYGRFQIVGVLGQGSMGVVLEAFDPELGRTVALKVIRRSRLVSERIVARFVAEARLTAQLDHPGIVPVHELGVTPNGKLFFVMKKVRGRSLRELIDALIRGDKDTRARWTRRRLIAAFVRICQAVAYAHERDVVHRDLKPENVMLGGFGEVVVMDWGVARMPEIVLGREGDLEAEIEEEMVKKPRTLHGTAVGTPGYMSPEQAMGQLDRIGPHSDVWSLGAILYEVLTLEPAYVADTMLDLMEAAMAGPPPHPDERVPSARVPSDLSDMCLRALDPSPDVRPGALELAEVLEGFLEGAQARQQADEHASAAREAWRRHESLIRERDELHDRLQRLEQRTPPWTPLDEKEALIEARERELALIGEIADTLEATVAESERALSHDSGHAGAQRLLADVYWTRFIEADKRGDAVDARHYAGRVRAYDGEGRYVRLLDGLGAVSIGTDPEGAEVWCHTVERSGLVWDVSEPTLLGHTPLERAPLPNGSYILRLVYPGTRDTTYPIQIKRGKHWRAEHPITLYTDAEIGEDWCYVPPGTFIAGGDAQAVDGFDRHEPRVDGFFISRVPVTAGEYCGFLNALHARDPELAWQRTPREISGRGVFLGQHWARPDEGDQYVVPDRDRNGDPWDRRWPIIAISWNDAQAYAQWRTSITGELHRLPRELEWEKAARGVDGRHFPWGDHFDATLCLMRDSRPENKLPGVVEAFPSDRSVYGAHDMAGSVGEWCAESSHRGDRSRRLVRGGSWLSGERKCRVASRDVLDLSWVYPSVGFRLVRPAPRG